MSEALQERASFRGVGKTRTRGLRERFACRSVLKDGSLVFIRPIQPGREPHVMDRYWRLMRRLPADWGNCFANVDHRRRLALMVERETVAGTRLVGLGRYESCDEAGTAEVTFMIENAWEHQQESDILLETVRGVAESRGVRRFNGYVLAANRGVLRLLATR